MKYKILYKFAEKMRDICETIILAIKVANDFENPKKEEKKENEGKSEKRE